MASPLVTTDWLEKHLDDADLRIIEVCASTEDQTYREGHIPGAVRWFWKDKCWNDTDRQFVTPKEAARHLGEIGVTPDTTVVLHGDPVQYGTYAFWALTMAGHEKLKLLDGSRKKWIAEGRPLSRSVPRFEPVKYKPGKADESMRVGRDNVRKALGKPGRMLLDVRTPEEYSGDRVMEYGQFDHGAERKGRIPGARHLFFRELLNEDDSFKDKAELETRFRRAGVDVKDGEEVVVYCRLSHRASLAWVALHHLLGRDNVKIYDGSWTEWGSIVGFPVEK